MEDEDVEGEQVFITISMDFTLRHLVVVHDYSALGYLQRLTVARALKPAFKAIISKNEGAKPTKRKKSRPKRFY